MRSSAFLITTLSLSALLLVGCQTRPGYAQRDVMPLSDGFGNARSLVLSTPAARTSEHIDRSIEPWYAGRRDFGPFVTAGTVSLREEQSVTFTRDRQSTINGRVFDRYDETTLRRTFRNSTR
ncbi:MAG: hypothetical protein AAGB26_05025 [Planctomycetota bacterium]